MVTEVVRLKAKGVLFAIILVLPLAMSQGIIIQGKDLELRGGDLILTKLQSCNFVYTDGTGKLVCGTGNIGGNISGSGGAGWLAKFKDSNTIENSVIKEESFCYEDPVAGHVCDPAVTVFGRLGVRTTNNPQYDLDVSGDARVTGNLLLTSYANCSNLYTDSDGRVKCGTGGTGSGSTSVPLNPQEVGFYDTPDYAYDVYVSGNYAYVADRDSGLRIIDISDPTNPHEVGHRDTPGRARDVYVSGNYAYVADMWGLQIIDVSDPSSPTIVGSVETSGGAADVYVSGGYAYVADFGASTSSLRVIDVSDPTDPTIVGSVDIGGGSESFGAVGVYVNGRYAYVTYWGIIGSTGMHIVDISDPANPTIVGSLNTPEAAYAVHVSGNYAYVADGYSVHVVDISDPFDPTVVGAVDSLDGVAVDIYVSGNYAYVSTVDNNSLVVVDISDPTDPTVVGSVDVPGPAHGVYVSGNYAYVAGGSAGLRIIDIYGTSTPSAGGGNISGSGTTDYIPKFTGSDTLGDSRIYEKEQCWNNPDRGYECYTAVTVKSPLGVGTDPAPLYMFDVNGDTSIRGELHVASTLRLDSYDDCAYLRTNSLGLVECGQGNVGGSNISGTASYLAKFTDSNTLGDSIIYEKSIMVDPDVFERAVIIDGLTFIGAEPTGHIYYKFYVNGDARITGTLYTGTLYAQGSIVFNNGFRITEDGSTGLIFLNPQGEPVMKIDASGNLWIKGEVRQLE